jgi:hypothetical protein
MRDYKAEDEALDRELETLYANDKEESESEAPAEAGTADEEAQETPEQQAAEEPTDEGTLNDADPIKEEQIEATVPEERYKNAEKAMHRAMQEAADLRKQGAARDSIMRDLQEQVKQLQDVKATKPKEEESSPQDAEEDLKEGFELYPEVVNPLMKRIKELEKKLSAVNADVGNVKQVSDRYAKSEAQTAEDKHWAFIKDKHADLDEIVTSKEYADWFPEQSPLIKEALQRGTAKDVVAALNLYRIEHPKSVPESVKETPAVVKPVADKLSEAKKASSPAVKSSTKPEQKPTYTTAQIAKMTRAEFVKHEDAIDAAMARGEIQ